MQPDRLGKYELRGTLGKGAMGVVYDAWDPVIERRIAVKTIRLPVVGDEEQAEEYARFKREAQAAGRLSHPGIVGVYDYGDADGIAYIAMELIEGRSLKDLLDAEHRLTPEATVRVMQELLDALAYSHSRGIIHRDIKPTNILLTDSGKLKITDFGIARIESSSMTQMGTVMGTPAYMSPEQFMGQAIDQRTDIYASGVLLYQLLTGERPFDGGLTAIMHKVLHTTPIKPSQLSVTAPEAFDAVVARAMARRPEDRYPSAEAFSAALTAALAGRAATAPASQGDDATVIFTATADVPPPAVIARPPATKLPSPAARRARPIALIGGIAAGLLVVLSIGTFLLLRPAAGPSPRPEQVASNTGAGVPPLVVPAPISSLALKQPPPEQPAATVVSAPITPAPQRAAPANATESSPEPSVLATPQVASAPAVELPQPAPSGAIPPQPRPLVSPAVPGSRPPGAASFRDAACTLLDPHTGPDNRTTVTGFVGAGAPESAALSLVAAPGARAVSLDWRAVQVDGPYCGVMDTLRAIRNAQGGNLPNFDLSLRGNRTKLRNGEIMAPVISALPFPAYLELVYFQSDRTVVHLFPTDAAQQRALPPGIPPRVGDPRRGGWAVGEPFGTDMMVAVVSSEPLPIRVADESADAYLDALRQEADELIQHGSTVIVRAVAVQTTR